LNRAIAIAELHGPSRGMEEIWRIEGGDRLSRYPFYWAAIGELEARQGRGQIAQGHFQKALSLARNPMERRFLQRKIEAQSSGPRMDESRDDDRLPGVPVGHSMRTDAGNLGQSV